MLIRFTIAALFFLTTIPAFAADKFELLPQAYPVMVDYKKSPIDMIHESNFIESPFVTRKANSFLFEANSFLFETSSVSEVELLLLLVNERAKVAEVLDEIDKRGLRAAGIEHLIMFGAQYSPEKDGDIFVELNTFVVEPDGEKWVPLISTMEVVKLRHLLLWGSVVDDVLNIESQSRFRPYHVLVFRRFES